MDSISSRVDKVAPSLTLSVTNQAKAMKARGEEVYGLAGGEPDQDTPDFIKQAAIDALNEGKTKYTPAAGIPELREAIAEKLKTDNGIDYDPRQIVVNSGAKQSCFNAILAVVEEGDEVIIPAPYWVSYPEMVRLAGGIPVIVETTAENDWKLTPEQFEENMTGLTKMIILNTPGNPTGSVYSADELKALGEVALYEDIIILSDEIYEHLVYGETKHTSIASLSKDLYDLTITVNGFSKAYSMTGWRIGYTAAPKPLADAISKIQGHTTSNATTFAQYGALAALAEGKDFIKDLNAEYDVRRQFVHGRLSAINNIKVVEPKGAFYCLVDTTDLGLKSVNLCDKLLTRYRVAAVPGIAFGNDNSIRISYCTTLDVLNEGLSRFEEFCKAH
ncbi:pyridoxal phosphate-dependent aminotransferase [Verrucomicrobiaceae bacterium R5-34]|uniref:Aminotransferase n=1 Tax=Oceaniferula flava TaxID=2800421 RepID=A0AAE2SE33_9BACT|nr:pyridoxal phosphate-dependent aminotransferase [Oceaniferula flavus]MBK1830239.1 pyridoxal phosphate-dependent aminotransferase [Verrucomicrobiaceae bacterium R5-34]MBK1854830.1 pyridoxal phosphate-dependent aminotransferase [Oceaniferula flavus]MBM1136136.1 pyridoxal phosphate-dependent aminotransferase [Oceaniferula flavus]